MYQDYYIPLGRGRSKGRSPDLNLSFDVMPNEEAVQMQKYILCYCMFLIIAKSRYTLMELADPVTLEHAIIKAIRDWKVV